MWFWDLDYFVIKLKILKDKKNKVGIDQNIEMWKEKKNPLSDELPKFESTIPRNIGGVGEGAKKKWMNK